VQRNAVEIRTFVVKSMKAGGRTLIVRFKFALPSRTANERSAASFGRLVLVQSQRTARCAEVRNIFTPSIERWAPEHAGEDARAPSRKTRKGDTRRDLARARRSRPCASSQPP
jgi:hypothetical protein